MPRLIKSGVEPTVIPAWFLQGDSGAWNSYSAGSDFNGFKTSGNGAFLQGGVSYNTGNGRLTLPLTGMYFFSSAMYADVGSGGDQRISFQVEGTELQLAHSHVDTGHTRTIHNSGVFAITAGQYCHLRVAYSGDIYEGDRHSYWTGMYIGPLG